MTSSRDFTAGLRDIFQRRERLTGDQVDAIVTAIAECAERYRCTRILPDLGPGTRRWLTRLTRRARALDACLDVVAFPSALEADQRTLRRQCQQLMGLVRALERSARSAALRATPTKGRRTDEPRAQMERDIALVLFTAGVRPTIASSGTLGQIFGLVYAEAGLDPLDPRDPKTALRRACAHLPR